MFVTVQQLSNACKLIILTSDSLYGLLLSLLLGYYKWIFGILIEIDLDLLIFGDFSVFRRVNGD